VTRSNEPTTVHNESIGAKIGRFFGGEIDGRTLTETLTRHGVDEKEAHRIENALQPNDVILTVEASNHPELAARIVEDCGGNVLYGESYVYTSVEWTESGGRTGSQLLGYEDPTEYARGQRVDDTELTRLRNERIQSGTIPTVSEDVFAMSYDEDEDADRSGIGSRDTTGTRSAGGAIGTQHREDLTP
jgi:hypothetical protein